ncbi:MAG TPA: nuclear transport factor 2 family protein [Gemmatimonadales bacterium]|nr:nuclear transport factor 2 family protein [Gemmatimonadales bacterium]
MMRITGVLLCLAILTSTAAAQSPASLPSVTLPPELDRVLREYEKNWRAGDENGLAALFTTDGFVPSNTGFVRGRDAIVAQYKDQQGELNLRAHAYAMSDTVGYIVGAYGFGTDGADRGKFVLALRRARGGPWLIAADIDQFNRTGPAPTAQQQAERDAVRRAALDYLEGFYEGDSAKIVRSVRPDVRKAGYYKARDAATYTAEEMPFADFLSYVRNFRSNNRTTPATAPREVTVGEVNDQTATAKVVAWWGIDYLQLAKYDGKWMIVNVIWQSPPPPPPPK